MTNRWKVAPVTVFTGTGKTFEEGRFIIKYIPAYFLCCVPGIRLVMDLIRKRMNRSRTNITAD